MANLCSKCDFNGMKQSKNDSRGEVAITATKDKNSHSNRLESVFITAFKVCSRLTMSKDFGPIKRTVREKTLSSVTPAQLPCERTPKSINLLLNEYIRWPLNSYRRRLIYRNHRTGCSFRSKHPLFKWDINGRLQWFENVCNSRRQPVGLKKSIDSQQSGSGYESYDSNGLKHTVFS